MHIMIEMFTARTSEIDEFDEAVQELIDQIDLSRLKKHSGGILFFHMDFVDSGMMNAICEALPFGVIGMTSMAGADEHGFGLFDLTLTVLTSDEVSFAVGMTNSIDPENYENEIQTLFDQMRAGVAEDPAMIISFMPYIRDVAGYEVVAAMDKACHGIPIWGSITNNADFNYETVQTMCNGKGC